MKRLLALFRNRRMERELENEVQAHLELAERDALAAGLSVEDARRQARQRFGGIEQMKEEHRDQRSVRWMETFLRDLRYGVSSLRRSPGFTAVVIGVLALGIGANVAMFSVVDAVLLKPLPFPDPDRIVRVWEAPYPGVANGTCAGEFVDWKRLGTSFAALAAEDSISVAMDGGAQPVRLEGKVVTADYFQVFGVTAARGRTLRADDDQSAVVLSHAAWQNYFGGDPAILGRRIMMDRLPHQVVGVLQPGAFDRSKTLFWKPLIFTPQQLASNNHWLTIYGRLGTSLAQAQEQMRAVYVALPSRGSLKDRSQATMVVRPLAGLLVRDALERSITVAFGAVLLVLLIACANVANLLLAKGSTRRRELAVRAALGAGRGRLVAQLLTESLVLCLLGAVAGVATASLLIRLLTPMLADSIPFTAEVVLDWRVLIFAGAVAVAVGLLAGVLPALQTSFGNLAEGLNRIVRGASNSSRIRRTIVIGEVALSLVLVCGALLLFRSLLKLQSIETGIRIENILTMSLDLPAAAYPTPEKAAIFYRNLAQRLTAVPGVMQTGLSTHIPLNWIMNGEGMQVSGVEKMVGTRFKRVDPGYFGTFAIPLIAGRGITDQDASGAPRVVVINQAMAARLAATTGIQDPVGKRVRLSSPGYLEPNDNMDEVEIIGVIRNERVSEPGRPIPPVTYAPLAQAPNLHIAIVIRSQSATILPAIRQAVRDIDPALPLANIATMEQVRSETLAGTSGPAKLIGAFAAIAVLLAAIGLYGVLSQLVTQQRREIGIRMALGAKSFDVLARVLRNGLVMVSIGLLLGITGAIALTRVMKNLLYEVSPLDPVALSVACISMTLIGLLAGYLPASRASRVDPVHVLRDEG